MNKVITSTQDFIDQRLQRAEWLKRQNEHRRSIAKIVDPYLKRSNITIKIL